MPHEYQPRTCQNQNQAQAHICPAKWSGPQSRSNRIDLESQRNQRKKSRQYPHKPHERRHAPSSRSWKQPSDVSRNRSRGLNKRNAFPTLWTNLSGVFTQTRYVISASHTLDASHSLIWFVVFRMWKHDHPAALPASDPCAPAQRSATPAARKVMRAQISLNGFMHVHALPPLTPPSPTPRVPPNSH